MGLHDVADIQKKGGGSTKEKMEETKTSPLRTIV